MNALRTTITRLGTAIGLAWSAQPVLLVVYVAANVLAGVAPAATIWLAKVAVDRLGAGSAAGELWTVGVSLAAVGLLVAALNPVTEYLQAELERSVAVRAKDELYRAVTGIGLLGQLEVPEFRDRLRLAEQASRAGPGQVVDSAVGLVRSGLTLAGVTGVVAVVDPAVAVVLCLAAVPALVAEVRLNRRRAATAWQISPAERREFFYSELLTHLGAAKELRLFGLGPLFRGRMLAELSSSQAEQRRFDRREGLTHLALASLSALIAGGTLVWVMLAAAGGVLTVGDATAVILAVGGVQSGLATTVSYVASGHHAGLLLDHYRAVLAIPPTAVRPGAEPARLTSKRGVELDDVWFRYGDDLPWVLRGVSVFIPKGEALALVGENGSGKSTLVKLLCRFYDPTRGSIRWDGVDVRDLPLVELHRRIGAVFQDFMTYDLRAEENIALGAVDGRPELDLVPAAIQEAARRAGMHEALTALPQAYQTMLSREFSESPQDDAEGVVLSGGQWQRLALARALVRGHRDLLILDEPSSGLDAEAESRIHQEIRRHRAGRTSVLVSHRLNAVRDADRILVLSAGRVVEHDRHDALMRADGTYARLFRLQAAGYQNAPVP
ncbi:MAG: ABC transporter ATP-binding protein [Angustibacter sp.]